MAFKALACTYFSRLIQPVSSHSQIKNKCAVLTHQSLSQDWHILPNPGWIQNAILSWLPIFPSTPHNLAPYVISQTPPSIASIQWWHAYIRWLANVRWFLSFWQMWHFSIFWIIVHRDVQYTLVRSKCSADVFFFLTLSSLEQTSPYQSYRDPLASASRTPAGTTPAAPPFSHPRYLPPPGQGSCWPWSQVEDSDAAGELRFCARHCGLQRQDLARFSHSLRHLLPLCSLHEGS